MALRRTLSKRLFKRFNDSISIDNSSIPSRPFQKPPNAAKTNIHHEFLTSPETAANGFFRQFIQPRSVNQSEFFSIPIGEKIKEKQKSMNLAGDRLRLDELRPPPVVSDSFGGITVEEAKKIMRSTQLEKLRSALRKMPVNSISYSEYVHTCVQLCSNRDQGVEFAKKLDESGNVIILGNVVFLRPEQVAKSMEKVISNSIAIPNDPRRKELEQLENQKAIIDQKARQLVQGELYCGLGFLVLQTVGFMRLTFWELSWDVMEPICFFVTSTHFALAYLFFLRTSKEPTFEGFSRRRFKAKQKKLMEVHKFDLEKYNELCKAFYPNYDSDFGKLGHFSALHRGQEAVFGAAGC